MKKERNISLDILRILACIGVITIHTAGSVAYHGWAEPGSLYWNLSETLDALSRWSVPIFAMLTGVIFLNPEKSLPYGRLYSKYIARIVISLVFWSLFYAFTLHKAYYPFGTQEGHFWYLGMCIGLYMAMPIMRLIAQNFWILQYFCYAWLGCKLYFFLGNFITLPFDISDIMFVDYVGYSLWAYYLTQIQYSKKRMTIMRVMTILGLLATVIAYIMSKKIDTCFGAYNSPNVIATSLGLFYLFFNTEVKIHEKLKGYIRQCAECTFGIYLVHIWILIQIFFRTHRFIESPILVVLICIPIVFISGWVITTIIKRIPILSKWIV